MHVLDDEKDVSFPTPKDKNQLSALKCVEIDFAKTLFEFWSKPMSISLYIKLKSIIPGLVTARWAVLDIKWTPCGRVVIVAMPKGVMFCNDEGMVYHNLRVCE